MADQYNDSHRLFVQAMLTKRILAETEAIQLYNEVCQVTGRTTDVEYGMFIAAVNKQLDLLDYALRITHDERAGQPYLTFINTKQDAWSEGATVFKPAEISYCRELFEEIVTADNEDYAISTTKAVRLGQKIKPQKLTGTETQNVLDQLVADKWIAQERKGVYYMDTRAIAELQNYLKEQYPDHIKECTICLDVITMGEYCAVSQCPVRIHKYCADNHFRNSQNPVCPQCSTRWSRNNTFGLGLPGQSARGQVPNPMAGPSGAQAADSEEEEEEEEDMLDEEG